MNSVPVPKVRCAKVACMVARASGAASVVLAAPVGAPDAVADLAASSAVDQVVCLRVPPLFMAVGLHYVDFRQTTDAEVQEILRSGR